MEKVLAKEVSEDGASEATEKETPDIEAKPEITYDVFDKLQFQVGEIIECKEVDGRRCLVITVDDTLTVNGVPVKAM